MKKLLSISSALILVLFCLGCGNQEKSAKAPVAPAKQETKSAPAVTKTASTNMIILHNTQAGEANVKVLRCCVIPNKDMDIHMHADEQSQVVGNIKAGKLVSIVAHELHTYPGKYPVTIEGKQGSVLAYEGEVFYYVLVDNKIKTLRLKLEQKPKADYWLCLRDTDGHEGWIMYKNYDDWKNSRFHGIYFEKAYIRGKYVNIRSAAGLNSDVIGSFKDSETVVELEQKEINNKLWIYVERKNGERGWVSRDFCRSFSRS